MTESQLEDFEERAAILEYMADYSREQAERMAKEMVGGNELLQRV